MNELEERLMACYRNSIESQIEALLELDEFKDLTDVEKEELFDRVAGEVESKLK